MAGSSRGGSGDDDGVVVVDQMMAAGEDRSRAARERDIQAATIEQ
jgi:hypothetical protein